eukprot:3123707-Amphidinium_carterae.1
MQQHEDTYTARTSVPVAFATLLCSGDFDVLFLAKKNKRTKSVTQMKKHSEHPSQSCGLLGTASRYALAATDHLGLNSTQSSRWAGSCHRSSGIPTAKKRDVAYTH